MSTKKSDKSKDPREARARAKATPAPKRKAAAEKPAGRPIASSGGARPRIKASHSDTAAGGELSDREKQKRRTRAKATVRSLGARSQLGRRELPPPASKRERDLSQQKRRSVPPDAPGPSQATRDLALAIAGAGLDKKAIGIEVIDVSGRVDYADYLVIMTGNSDRHVHAIAMGIEEDLKKNKKVVPLSVEGLGAATWVLMDFDDIVVHVFQEETRRVYDIEGLWMDASRLPVADAPPQA